MSGDFTWKLWDQEHPEAERDVKLMIVYLSTGCLPPAVKYETRNTAASFQEVWDGGGKIVAWRYAA